MNNRKWQNRTFKKNKQKNICIQFQLCFHLIRNESNFLFLNWKNNTQIKRVTFVLLKMVEDPKIPPMFTSKKARRFLYWGERGASFLDREFEM